MRSGFKYTHEVVTEMKEMLNSKAFVYFTAEPVARINVRFGDFGMCIGIQTVQEHCNAGYSVNECAAAIVEMIRKECSLRIANPEYKM